MARAKKKKYTMAVFAGCGFVLGFVLSSVLFITLITYPIHDNTFLNSVSHALRAGIDNVFNFGRKEAYGRIDAIGEGVLTMTTNRAGITRVYHVRFDESTKFYTFAPDDKLSEVLLTPEDIRPGEYASITTAEPIGSVKEQKILTVLLI